MAVIEIEGLTKDYGHGRGVFDVSFRVEEGEVYGFLGPNGAGKTTTIRHIMGFLKPQSGSVKVGGLDSWVHPREIHRNLGYLPGEIAFPETMSGTEFLRMMADLRGIRDMAHVRRLMERFELDPSGSLKQMSLGTKRKLAIVTAFMHDPAVLVLDEPTSGLDPIMQSVFVEFIREEKARGKTILMSSHIFREVEASCDTVSIIKDGRLVADFAADDWRNRPETIYELRFVSKEEYDRFAREAGAGENLAVVTVREEAINEFVAFLAGYELASLSEIRQSLEDAFMKFYGRDMDGAGRPETNGAH